MADSEGIQLDLPTPLGRRSIPFGLGAGGLAAVVAALAGLSGWQAALVGSVPFLVLHSRTTLLFRADTLQVRWLVHRKLIPYGELTGFAVLPDRIRLRLSGGRSYDLRIEPEDHGTGETLRAAVAHLLTLTSGVEPDGGAIGSIDGRPLPKLALPKDADALTTTLRNGSSFARARGESEIITADSLQPSYVDRSARSSRDAGSTRSSCRPHLERRRPIGATRRSRHRPR